MTNFHLTPTHFAAVLTLSWFIQVCAHTNQFDNNDSPFSVNVAFLEHPFPRTVVVPHYLILEFLNILKNTSGLARYSNTNWSKQSRNRGRLFRTVEDITIRQEQTKNCLSIQATDKCCKKWYIKNTIQYKVCMADATGNNPVFYNDAFNEADENKVYRCLFHNFKILGECCHDLNPISQNAVKECENKRMNIMENGLRVCVLSEDNGRAECCGAIFKGQIILYSRCNRGVAVFVNRRAPCLFRDTNEQTKCCRQVFPSDEETDGTTLHAYTLCITDVQARKSHPVRCLFENINKKKKCCSQNQIYGKKSVKKCMAQWVPPCHSPEFMERIYCCFAHFPSIGKPKSKYLACAAYPSHNCQQKTWQSRLACCATKYNVGSQSMKNCLYQYVELEYNMDYEKRFNSCWNQFPPGSKLFTNCLSFPIVYCHLSSSYKADKKGKSETEEHKICCKKMFKNNVAGEDTCVGRFTLNDLLTDYNNTIRHWDYFSDTLLPAEARVSYCERHFLHQKWLSYACLSEMTYNVGDPELYHFTLFSDSALVEHSEITCLVFDENERAWCCNINFPGASLSFLRCMQAYPKLLRENYGEISEFEDAVHMYELHKATNNSNFKKEYSNNNGSYHRKLVMFLEQMRCVEEDIHNGVVIGAEKLQVYETFKKMFSQTVRSGMSATFYEMGCMCWRTCAMVYHKKVVWKAGVLYCGRVDGIGGGRDIERLPILGWEGGAVERIVDGNAKKEEEGRSSNMRKHLRMAGGFDADNFSRRTVNHDSQIQSVYSDFSRSVNLFGSAKECGLTNLIYTCNALCCDTYFAYSWICQGKSLDCVG